jgi:hypothetical protein
MSDKVYNSLSRSFGKVNDALRRVFQRDNTVLYLLRRDQYTGGFDQLKELTGGYVVEYGISARGYISGDLREDIFVDCTDTDDDFLDAWISSSHVAFGVPDAQNEVYIYEMTPDQKDQTTADGLAPTYKAFCTRLANERYKVD